ncbi:MAG TPA: LptA/OstA family protein [Thermodesulfovibrionales bacterium]|nr:LptA/OstA family protein [Thermodesulfovibrionales bacterium]
MTKKLIAHSSLLIALCFCFQTVPSFAVEPTTIEAERLDYDAGSSTYTGKGKVKVKRELTTVDADEMTYNEETSDLTAEGNVDYNEPETRIRAKRAELNLDAKTGTLYDAEIFSRKDNFHIIGDEVEKTGENAYTLKKASITSCDAPVPEWCFYGSDVHVLAGDNLKAKDVTFDIEGLPVLYSPYFYSGLGRERSTGLLLPSVGVASSKGVHYEQPFFWAIAENMDATLLLDVYTARGVGEGLQYRFLEPDGSKGNLWVYHLKDNTLGQDFWDLRGSYDRDRDAKLTAYLNINYINSQEFYSDYNSFFLGGGTQLLDSSSYLNAASGRFLESTGEVSMKLGNSRLFVASQYLVDLQAGVNPSTVAQRLPEVGYFVNPMNIGPVVFSLASTFSNFWREINPSGQRIDIFPRFSYAFGSDVVINQSLGLRETAYALSGGDGFGTSPHRESFDYTVTAQTRLVRRYDSFTHIIEPSVGYSFIPPAESNLPVFDSTELYTKTSTAQLSLLNRFLDSDGEFLTLRITQPYDLDQSDHHLLPITLQAALQRPVSLRADASYDTNTGSVASVNSDIGITLPYKVVLTLGERYNTTASVLFYTAGMSYVFSKEISAETTFWYDARGGGLQDMLAKIKYQKQCWGLNMTVGKNQSGYSVLVTVDLLGLGTVKL